VSASAELRVKLIGCGGIGGHLAVNLCHFLHAERHAAHVTLVDGDAYEARNLARMRFSSFDNKAVVMARDLATAFGDFLCVEPRPAYVTPDNVGSIVVEQDFVFLAVDNHATRRLVDERCAALDDVVLISGGNDGLDDGQEGTYGTVHVVRRSAGVKLGPRLVELHPEIADPSDRLPTELGCEALAESGGSQLLFTNLAVASAMLNAFYAAWRGRLGYAEVYLDIVKNRVVPVAR
jgi:molybdopterin/thiamine biosynthesis adenylyltransferase